MSTGTDKSLVERVRQGDQDALGQLLQAYQQRLYNVVYRMVSHRDDAAEVTQDAMLRIIQHIGQFKGQSDISTWMIRIAMNLSISHLRKRKVRRTVSLDSAAGLGSTGYASGGGGYGDDQSKPLRQQLSDQREPEPQLCVQQTEEIALLHGALERLELDFRSVLILRDIEQMDYQKIATVLAIPVGTVKSRLFRARLALRHEMLEPDSTKDRTVPSPEARGGEPGETPGETPGEAPGRAKGGEPGADLSDQQAKPTATPEGTADG